MEMRIHKKYFYRLIVVLAGLVFASMAGSSYLYKKNIPQTGNDLLIQRALTILRTKKDITTIIVGDSSAGNAIDAKYWESISGLRTENLALTGSFGFIGSYNMIRHAYLKQEKLKNVIIINTLDIWRRPFNEQAFFDTMGDLPGVELTLASKKIRLNSALHYRFNPREIYWYFKYRYFKEISDTVSSKNRIENDYLAQEENRFSNEKKNVGPDEVISSLINEDQLRIYQALGALCRDLSLNCIFMHGPIHEKVYVRSYDAIADINDRIKEIYIPASDTKVFSYPNEKLGDSVDHIDPLYKKEVTKEYFESIQNRLIYK